MSTITTRCDGHLITATRINDTWEVQIDSHLPLMERDFYMRSTYCSADPGIAIRVAMCQILGYAETIREGVI